MSDIQRSIGMQYCGEVTVFVSVSSIEIKFYKQVFRLLNAVVFLFSKNSFDAPCHVSSLLLGCTSGKARQQGTQMSSLGIFPFGGV